MQRYLIRTILVSAVLSMSIFDVCAVCPSIDPVVSPTYVPINPQPGENLWGLTNRIALAVDSMGPVVRDTALELNDLADTSSLCCPCTCFITQADIPLVITQPGTYCLTEDLLFVLFDGTMIDIQSDNVIIDLRGHAIVADGALPSAVIINALDHNGITIKNGTINTAGGLGIQIGGCHKIKIENCDVSNSFGSAIRLTASLLSRVEVATISNCRVQANGGSGALRMEGSLFVVINNCVADSSAAGAGFDIDSSTDVTFRDCCSYINNHGFVTDTASSKLSFWNCEAYENLQDGFRIDAQDSQLNNCIAAANLNNGFTINPTASATASISVVGCIAKRNGGIGISNGTLASSYIFNSISTANTGGNYLNVTATTLVSSNTVSTSTGYWSNING